MVGEELRDSTGQITQGLVNHSKALDGYSEQNESFEHKSEWRYVYF
jgi:hypothetical protein